jgi:hypothetical protein
MEKETAHRTGAGNVEAPAPIVRERERGGGGGWELWMMMHLVILEPYKGAARDKCP